MWVCQRGQIGKPSIQDSKTSLNQIHAPHSTTLEINSPSTSKTHFQIFTVSAQRWKCFRHSFALTDSTRSLARLAGKQGHAAAEIIPIPSIQTRKISTVLYDSNGNEEEPAAVWSKSESSESLMEDGGQSGKGISGSSRPPAIPKQHPVNVQNGIYAAERLSSSLEITHSINFILRGKVYSSQLPKHGADETWYLRDNDIHYVVGQAERYSNKRLRYNQQPSPLPPGSPHHPKV